MAVEPDVEQHLRAITRSLEIEFAGRVSRSEVAEVVQEALARYQGARIRQYVTVFVARDARAALRRRAHRAA